MKYSFLFLLFLCLPVASFAQLDYQLDIQLFPEKQLLDATAKITPDNLLLKKAEFTLAADCEVLAIQQSGRDLRYSFSQGLLQVELNTTEQFSIHYRGYFSDPVSTTPIHNEDPSYGVAAVISEQGTFLSASADWYPRLATEKINYQLKVTSPIGTEAISSGRRTSRSGEDGFTQSTWEVDYPLYGLTLSAGPYQVFENLDGGVPIYAYFYAATAHLAPVYLQAAREYLTLYQELFGPYPFHKFAIVENFFPTGYGLPSWTLLGSTVIRLPFIIKTSLGHEIAHSWWGTGVRVDYAQGNWAEGLTTYVADYLYNERTSAHDALEYRLKILRDYAVLVDPDTVFPVSKFMSRNDRASQAIGYGKAALLFHMLRKQVGDKIFWDTLKKIAQERLFTSLAWGDFADDFSAATATEMQPFFMQWLTRTTGPVLELQDVKSEKTAAGYITRGTVVQQPPYYQLGIDIQVSVGSDQIRETIQHGGEAADFSIFTSARPDSVTVDPDTDLFRELSSDEIPATINAIRGSDNLLVLSAGNLSPSEAALQTLLGALRKSALKVEPEDSFSVDEFAQNDLLIFGASERLRPEMLKNGGLFMAELNDEMKNKSAFIVLPNPFNTQHTAAWFLSGDKANDAIVARKIPHYGKYSYLLFEDIHNRLKGTFAPQRNPLKVDLPH